MRSTPTSGSPADLEVLPVDGDGETPPPPTARRRLSWFDLAQTLAVVVIAVCIVLIATAERHTARAEERYACYRWADSYRPDSRPDLGPMPTQEDLERRARVIREACR